MLRADGRVLVAFQVAVYKLHRLSGEQVSVGAPLAVQPDGAAVEEDEAALARARAAADDEFELVDGEGFEWSGPELVA